MTEQKITTEPIEGSQYEMEIDRTHEMNEHTRRVTISLRDTTVEGAPARPFVDIMRDFRLSTMSRDHAEVNWSAKGSVPVAIAEACAAALARAVEIAREMDAVA